MGWKPDESGTGESVLRPVKLEKRYNTLLTSNMPSNLFRLSEFHLDFDSWSWLPLFSFSWNSPWLTHNNRCFSCLLISNQILGRGALQVLSFRMVCHRFCPQALAKALRVNKTVTKIDLRWNFLGNGGAKAWCLGRGFVATGFGRAEYTGIKWCTSGV